MNKFVDRIDELLSQKGLSRTSLYKEFSIPKNLIGQWKQRGTIPSADIAVKIAKYLNTTVEYLVTGEEPNAELCNNNVLQEKLNKIKEVINS